jgi:MoaE-MoaD fusion protein
MLKDIVGRAGDELEMESGATLGDVFDHYVEVYPRIGEYKGSIVLARNHDFGNRGDTVAEGDEIAFMPPVSGGSGYTQSIVDEEGRFFALTRDEIKIDPLKEKLLQGCDGAFIVFEGVVRNNTKGRSTLRLEYECYEEMAVKMMARIGAEIAGEHEISRIGMVHRLGVMEIGETSVAIVVAAPHRKPAYAASLEGINRLKRLVPIWKKEYFADGEVWVQGEWDDSVLNR